MVDPSAAADVGPRPASPFADKRGGPAVYSGVGYQTAWATKLALDGVLGQLTDPGLALVLRLEPRVLVKGGQRGYDVGVDGAGLSVRYEAKVKPSKDDVLGVVRGLRVLLDALPRPVVLLVAGAPGVWFTALSTLHDLATEAGDETEFAALVAAADDERLRDLVAGLGDGPWRTAGLLGAPLLMPPDVLDDQVRRSAVTLGGHARHTDLALRCADRLSTAALTRATLPVSVLAGELEAAGLLRPVMAVPQDDDRLVQALAVLAACGSPLPAEVLGEVLGLSVDGVLALLAGQAEAGGVVVEDGRLSRPLTAYRLDASYAGPALADTLTALLRLPAADRPTAVSQAFNTYLLCRLLLASRPDLVAAAFKAYDKCVKSTGSLLLVAALAQQSLAAVARSARDPLGADAEEMRRLLWLRGHAQICGTSWVYQRVGLHDRAAEEMAQARRDGLEHGHGDNVAFADKCQGRISRVRGEALAATGDHDGAAARYDASGDELAAAHQEFDALVRGGRTQYDEEPGECLSLSARTRLSASDLDAAEALSAGAHVALAGVDRPSKAVADQQLLDVEIGLARLAERDEGPGDPVEIVAALRDMARACESVVADFTLPAPSRPEPGVNVGESEIRGRAQRVLGGLRMRLGDRDLAAEAFDAASAEFADVEQTVLRYECALQALECRGAVPDRLAEVLDALGASPGARVEAHRLYAEEDGDRRSPAQLEGLVTRAREVADLRQHRWGETAA